VKVAWLIGATFLAGLSGLCQPPDLGKGSASPTPTVAPVVAWRDLPATNVVPSPPPPKILPPIPIPAGAKACTAGQLEAKFFGFLGATGHTDSPVDLRNRSGNPCFVEGFPDVTILDSSGVLLAKAAGTDQRRTFFGDPPVVPILLLTDTPPLGSPSGMIQERPGGQAEVHIEWYDCRSPKTASMNIDLPRGGGRLSIDYAVDAPSSPGCGVPNMPLSFLARGPFIPTGMFWPPQPVVLGFEATMSAPTMAKRGDPLNFSVTVKNASPVDYILDPCPDYLVELDWKNQIARYQLNCAPIGHIAPGSSVTFEMRLRVPLYMMPGSYPLKWALFDGRVGGAVASKTIEIT
jgi:hypothetical protein